MAPRLNVRALRPYPEVQYPPENPYRQAKARLGKILFWDEQLSDDDSIACGTCHRPSAGGADPRPAGERRGHPGPDAVRGNDDDPRGSPGIRRCVRGADGVKTPQAAPPFDADVQVTRRRAMSMADAMFWPALFWDGRAADVFRDPRAPEQRIVPQLAALETQALMPLGSSVEMACEPRELAELATKLERVQPLALAHALPADLAQAIAEASGYPALFAAAFGTAEISEARVALAIATYERTLTSDQTPWDRWRAGDDAALDAQAQRGFELFTGKAGCACCHAPPLFGSQLYVNDGFSRSTWDEGRAEVTHQARDVAAFRAPGLRNVGLREPAGLLHDGLPPGDSLESLIDAYTAPPLVGGDAILCARRGFEADAEERAALVEFLRHGLTDPRMRDELPPFDRPHLSSE